MSVRLASSISIIAMVLFAVLSGLPAMVHALA